VERNGLSFENNSLLQSRELIDRIFITPVINSIFLARLTRKAIGSDGGVDIWHETYLVEPGEYEAVYGNMPVSGLASATKHVPAESCLKLCAGFPTSLPADLATPLLSKQSHRSQSARSQGALAVVDRDQAGPGSPQPARESICHRQWGRSGAR